MRERGVFSGGAGGVTLDSRHFPVVLISWSGQVEERTLEMQVAWLDRMLAWMEATNSRGVLISDLSRAERPPPTMRKRIGEIRERRDAQLRTWMVDDIVVIENVMIRGVITAIQWVHPGVRSVTLPSLAKALDHARIVLRDAGISAPSLSPSDFAP